jgi:hypothetical protein
MITLAYATRASDTSDSRKVFSCVLTFFAFAFAKRRRYLQCWFEGGAFVDNVTVANNTWHFGAGVDPVMANPVDTSGIVNVGNRFLPPAATTP